ncbi:spinster family MFS transporter [Nocardiopsis salina]|uniref:spinster family MFS transporter n=1 Tax=Nocardiopsis salina TaxID=245836 RepID=UPI00034955B0|nr:MFS transporter [Nocardiopsis salina]
MALPDSRTSAADARRGTLADPRVIIVLLFLANLLNFYDRTIPAIVTEPIKAEFSITDAQIGMISAAFTIVYALFGIPLGRLADRYSRKAILIVGLVAWSLFTAATGMAGGFIMLVVIRLLVGVGEAAFAPAANSLIADMCPSKKRAGAVGLFQLGLPVGLTLAFFTVGPITEAFDSWRAAFVLAAIPGLLLAVVMLFMREPERGSTEADRAVDRGDKPFRRLVAVPTLWWLSIAGIGIQVSAYAVSTFSVPLFQRYFDTSMSMGGLYAGITIGVTGLIGLTLGGRIADWASRASVVGRVLTGAVALSLAAPLTFGAFLLGPDAVGLFVLIFSAGWLLQYMFFTAAYPAIGDVVGPRLRGTAFALYLAASYLMGGAFGPVVAGALSDRFTADAAADGLSAAEAGAVGLHAGLMVVIPAGLLIAGLGLFAAARYVRRDHQRMRESLERIEDA